MALMFSDWLIKGKDPEREIDKATEKEKHSSTTLKDFFPVFMDHYCSYQSENMVQLYRERFKNIQRCPALCDCPIGDISRKLLMDYAQARVKQDGVSNATVNREITVVKTMLNRAAEWEILDRNPLVKMNLLPESKKREVDLSVEDAERLIRELTEPFGKVVEYAIYTGFRRENILSLKIEQIRFHDIGNTGEVKLRMKGGHFKTFPLGPSAVNVIKRAIGKRKKGYDFINPSTGTRFHSVSKSFRRVVKKLNLRVGDSYLRFHDLRHVFATWLHREGVNLDVLRVLLDHQKRSTTDRYKTVSTLGAGKVLSLMLR